MEDPSETREWCGREEQPVFLTVYPWTELKRMPQGLGNASKSDSWKTFLNHQLVCTASPPAGCPVIIVQTQAPAVKAILLSAQS